MSATECVILDILMKCASFLVISIDAFDMWTSDVGYFDEMCLVLISMRDPEFLMIILTCGLVLIHFYLLCIIYVR